MNARKPLSLAALLVISLAGDPPSARANDRDFSHDGLKQNHRQIVSDREALHNEQESQIYYRKPSRDPGAGLTAAQLENERVRLQKLTEELQSAREELEKQTEALINRRDLR